MIKDILLESCRRYSDRTACRIDGVEITYSELLAKAITKADIFKTQSRKPLILRQTHCIDEIIDVLACILAGRAYVPVNPSMPPARIEAIQKNIDTFGTSSETAYIIFTSGSTGEPKGVPISYGNLTCFTEWIRTVSPLDTYEGIRVLNQASLSFDLSVADLYYALSNGHTWVAFSKGLWENDACISKVFHDENINVAVMTPSAMNLCLLDSDFSACNMPDFRCVYFCGERLEKRTVKKLWERFPSLEIINAYGPTEATSAVCAVRLTHDMPDLEEELPVGRIGEAFTNIETENGEIILSGASVFSGYLNNSVSSYSSSVREGQCFIKNNMNAYRTGDCGRIANGLLYCDGRLDSQIKYKGYRIELYDIENNLNRIPGVLESAVTAPRNASGTVKTLQAFCVTESDGIDSVYIKNALREKLPEYMIPKTIHIVERLPISTNGKIDRKALENND